MGEEISSATTLCIRTDPENERFCWGIPDEAAYDQDGRLLYEGEWHIMNIVDNEYFLRINKLLNTDLQAAVVLVLAMHESTKQDSYNKGFADGFNDEGLTPSGGTY